MNPPKPVDSIDTADPGAARRRRVYLHVGAAKSGTTFLQRVLWQNRDRLRELGLCYPGRDFAAHVRAAFDLRQAFFGGGVDPTTRGAWRELVDEVAAAGGDAVISQELFAPATAEHVERVLHDLAFAEVHLIFTARDLARQLPAHWQEDVKNRFTASFQEFIDLVRDTRYQENDQARKFWQLQDPVAILRRWSADLPADRVHIVTLPPPGAPRDVLWRRFCEVVGLPVDVCDLSGAYANPSLGLAETQVLLKLNRELDERVGWTTYNTVVKHHLAQGVLNRRPEPAPIRLPAAEHGWVTEWAERTIADLAAAGYRVIGDLAELRPKPPASTAHPDVPLATADAAIEALTSLLVAARDSAHDRASTRAPAPGRREQVRHLLGETVELRRLTAELARQSTPPVRRMAGELTARHPGLRRLHEAYAKTRVRE